MKDSTITVTSPVHHHEELHETTEQFRARAAFDGWIDIYKSTVEQATRRVAAQQLRSMARTYPWLADQIPQDVWDAIYRVRAPSGTVAP